MRFFHHFALEVDEESIADKFERGKVCPINILKNCTLLFYDFEKQMMTELFKSLSTSRIGKNLSNKTYQTKIMEAWMWRFIKSGSLSGPVCTTTDFLSLF